MIEFEAEGKEVIKQFTTAKNTLALKEYSKKFLSFIKNDKIYLEREPLEKVTKLKQFSAYRHNGFWQCIDNMRDLISINKKIKEKKIIL